MSVAPISINRFRELAPDGDAAVKELVEVFLDAARQCGRDFRLVAQGATRSCAAGVSDCDTVETDDGEPHAQVPRMRTFRKTGTRRCGVSRRNAVIIAGSAGGSFLYSPSVEKRESIR